MHRHCNLIRRSDQIIALVSNGSPEEALNLYKHCLHSSGFPTHSIPSVLKACSSSSPRFLCSALQIHCQVIKTGLASETVTANSLLAAYFKLSRVGEARLVFDTMPFKDPVTYNSMVMGYARNGCLAEAIDVFHETVSLGLHLRPELIAAVVSSCGRMSRSALGRRIHAHVIRRGGNLDASVVLSTALVDMYSRCLDMRAAMTVFRTMPERNVVSWTAMIDGCTVNGDHETAIGLLREMVSVKGGGLKPNRATLVSVLPACAESGVGLRPGKEIHGHIFRNGFASESRIASALVDMYGKCKGGLHLASLVFERTEEKDVVAWSSIIGTRSRGGDGIGALVLFRRMCSDGVRPNHVTMLAVISACIGLTSIIGGQLVHCFIMKSGLNLEVSVANSLIDMYAKCGCLESSVHVFDEMRNRDTVSWTCIISSYGFHGRGTDALGVYDEMLKNGIRTDWITSLATLSACVHSGLIEEGLKIINKTASQPEHFVSFVDLLCRADRVKDACKVVMTSDVKDPKTWTCLVSALRARGELEAAKELGHRLIELEPENSVNYVLLSSVYAEAGDWEFAEKLRRLMQLRGLEKDYGFSSVSGEVIHRYL
ncbi:Pentatricopeptide repeat-containing protein [Acorus gramineus]|uniref:Pentatricopeptide repeat-containing protein n=1 Tax=Acorus gramineus TaxID=55184 RepID=A0AAV9BDW0_ACOGR|nr:Pentatricopeptide repeat-containing protein [Acorus gramineus]